MGGYAALGAAVQSQDSPPTPAPFRGGRRAAEAALAAIDPQRYGSSRNHLEGAVTRLSPYIRHGVLTLAEVRQAVFAWLNAQGFGVPERQAEGRQVAAKLIQELGWRDYWQRLWLQLGDGIWENREPLKTGHPASAYSPELPADVAAARTDLACMDAFSSQLQELGWLHNHARLWLASYLVHWRRVQWQAGARWFLQHLLDGDPASNNLSWQWVASSFSHKPYVFNRANLERFGGGLHCQSCPAAAQGRCPFAATYEELQQQLFPQAATPAAEIPTPAISTPTPPPTHTNHQPQRPLLWIHSEALGPTNPALRAFPDQPALLVLDPALRQSPKRRDFLQECASELPLELREGDIATTLLEAARQQGADAIVTSKTVDPALQRISRQLAEQAPIPLIELAPDPFVELEEPLDLGRFSRYWRRAERKVWAQWTPLP